MWCTQEDSNLLAGASHLPDRKRGCMSLLSEASDHYLRFDTPTFSDAYAEITLLHEALKMGDVS